MPSDPADTVVVVGRIGRPYGVRGWLNVTSYTDPPENLLGYSPWMVNGAQGWNVIETRQSRAHRGGFVVSLAGVDDRDAAARMSGLDIGVTRATLPAPQNDEYYWRDLIGLEVLNVRSESLGEVEDLISTGAHDVLVVGSSRPTPRLIPFVDAIVERVEAGNRIVVRWEADWE